MNIIRGDVLAVLPTLDASSFDACLCDPPYGLKFMGKDWDHGIPGVPHWAEVFRALKPGAFLLAFGGTRTHHRLMCAIEDAGFEIRDCMMWLYGSGFPKSLDIGKQIDKRKDWTKLAAFQGNVKRARLALGISQSEAARRCGLIGPDESLGGGGFMWYETGMRIPTHRQYRKLKAALCLTSECDGAFQAAEREVLGQRNGNDCVNGDMYRPGAGTYIRKLFDVSAPSTDAAKIWNGYGTALKPAWEPIIVAMKPCDGTFAENALRHGVAGINIEAARIGTSEQLNGGRHCRNAIGRDSNSYMAGINKPSIEPHVQPTGRWPANVILDEEAGAMLDEQSGQLAAGGFPRVRNASGYSGGLEQGETPHGDIRMNAGGASRFFYCAKASKSERGEGNNHPTVKPLKLLEYLARLILPPSGGKLLVPFSGSGSECLGARNAGWTDITGVDQSAEYCAVARRRLGIAKRAA
jgi:DNA modification methylase/transcriptional regulator with XRE-family HTH domain